MKEKLIKPVIMVLLMCCVCSISTSCSKDDEEEFSYISLFRTTDYFIDMLDTVYKHYDVFGKKKKDSSDGMFTVTPIGRMIIVKKKITAGTISYSELEVALKSHYINNFKVNDVYQNKGGTVTIDCRN